MIAPQRRIVLFAGASHALEIVVLGDPEQLAIFMHELRLVLEHWHGFEAVQPLVMGTQVIGFVARRSVLATHENPISEAILMMRRWPIEWPALYSNGVMVGTW